MKKKKMTLAEAIKELIRIKESYSYDGTDGGFALEDCLLESEIEALDLTIDLLEKRRGLPRPGDTVYHTYYELNFPSEAEVVEMVADDVSEKGMIYCEKDGDWYNFRDPDERLFLTREEAEAKLEELEKHDRKVEGTRWKYRK